MGSSAVFEELEFMGSDASGVSIVSEVSVLLSEQPDVRRMNVITNRMRRCRWFMIVSWTGDLIKVVRRRIHFAISFSFSLTASSIS